MTGIADASAIVAYLNRREGAHPWAVEQFQVYPAPLLTCEAALAEASFLVRQLPGGPLAVLRLVRSGALRVAFDLQAERDGVADIVERYADVPASLADACLVRMAEMHPDATVLTLDSDFHVYRKHRREAIAVSMPPVAS